MNVQSKKILNDLSNDINQLLGFHEEIPRINYGPCGVFAKLFYEAWNICFPEKVHICFVMTPSLDECDHVVIRLPTGNLFDGGSGVHSDNFYTAKFIIQDMLEYDHATLEKWSYGLDRTYPRFCPDFDKSKVKYLIDYHLNRLSKIKNQSKQSQKSKALKSESAINQKIYRLELSLLTPEVRQSTEQLNQLITDNFIEFGSSGTIYNKENLLESLPIEQTEHYKVEEFKTTQLSKNIILATYKVTIRSQQSLRSSIWKYNGSHWQMVFHQGTYC